MPFYQSRSPDFGPILSSGCGFKIYQAVSSCQGMGQLVGTTPRLNKHWPPGWDLLQCRPDGVTVCRTSVALDDTGIRHYEDCGPWTLTVILTAVFPFGV